MYYLVEGLKTVQLFPKISIAAKTWFLGSLVLATYLNMIWFYIITADNINPGPQEEASIQAFEHIKNTTSDDAVFLFSKPRVLALYAERQCLANSKNDNDENISILLEAYEIDYILVHQEVSDEAIKRFIKNHQEHLKEEYINTKFMLYKNLSGL